MSKNSKLNLQKSLLAIHLLNFITSKTTKNKKRRKISNAQKL